MDLKALVYTIPHTNVGIVNIWQVDLVVLILKLSMSLLPARVRIWSGLPNPYVFHNFLTGGTNTPKEWVRKRQTNCHFGMEYEYNLATGTRVAKFFFLWGRLWMLYSNEKNLDQLSLILLGVLDHQEAPSNLNDSSLLIRKVTEPKPTHFEVVALTRTFPPRCSSVTIVCQPRSPQLGEWG